MSQERLLGLDEKAPSTRKVVGVFCAVWGSYAYIHSLRLAWAMLKSKFQADTGYSMV